MKQPAITFEPIKLVTGQKRFVTIEYINVINIGVNYDSEEVVRFYHPATIILIGSIGKSFKKPALMVRKDDHHQMGIFYPIGKKTIQLGLKHFLKLSAASCLIDRGYAYGEALAGNSSWYGDFSPVTRILFQKFDPTMNKVRCVGDFDPLTQTIKKHCKQIAQWSQYFHIDGEIQRFIPVCEEHIKNPNYYEGFGKVTPAPFMKVVKAYKEE